MATRKSKSPAARKAGAAKSAPAKTRAKAAPKAAARASPMLSAGAFAMPDPAQFAKFAKVITPEQAFDLYKTNAKIALEIVAIRPYYLTPNGEVAGNPAGSFSATRDHPIIRRFQALAESSAAGLSVFASSASPRKLSCRASCEPRNTHLVTFPSRPT